jgi:hypothetical protein
MAGLIVLRIILALIALLLLVLLLPVGVRIRYNQEGVKLWYVIGPVRLLHKAKEDKKKTKKKDDGLNIRKMLGMSDHEADSVWEKFRTDLQLIFSLFGYLRPKIKIQYLELKLNLAGGSPGTLAMAYGGAWAAIGGFLPVLEEAFILKKRDLDVTCDFNGDATTLEAKLNLTIGLGRLLICLIRWVLASSDKTVTKL